MAVFFSKRSYSIIPASTDFLYNRCLVFVAVLDELLTGSILQTASEQDLFPNTKAICGTNFREIQGPQIRHEFHELTSDGACEAALSGAVEEVVGRTKRLGVIGALSATASRRPSEALSVAFLNSLMPWPRPLASSGNFLAPNRIKTIARIKMISPPPTLNRPNMIRI